MTAETSSLTANVRPVVITKQQGDRAFNKAQVNAETALRQVQAQANAVVTTPASRATMLLAHSTNQSWSAAAVYFDTLGYAQGGLSLGVLGNAGNGSFVVPATGPYRVSAAVAFTSGSYTILAGDTLTLSLLVNRNGTLVTLASSLPTSAVGTAAGLQLGASFAATPSLLAGRSLGLGLSVVSSGVVVAPSITATLVCVPAYCFLEVTGV